MDKPTILDLTKSELSDAIKPAFRAKQIYGWLYHQHVDRFDEMINLPKAMRAELEERFAICPLKMLTKQVSRDGSIKYLFELHDGHTIEVVLLLMREAQYHEDGTLKHHPRFTICVSSQVGCKVGCAFCLTAKGGFVRDLSPGEIVAQVRAIKKDIGLPSHHRVNIVYMGMGEPLDNLDNLAQAIRIFSDPDGMAISPHRQTVSTSGLSTKIDKLGKMDLGVNLAISLHAVDDDLREQLMPINKAYNIESIMEAVRRFPVNLRKKVMFEYLVIKDVNDGIDAAKKLLKLLNGIKAKVNLIYFNPYPGTDFQRPDEKDMLAFQEYLLSHGQLCTIRESKGLDISAACGQLREQNKDTLS
jgi:23S rRNA (adenine2503-C2)-methyltransferase